MQANSKITRVKPPTPPPILIIAGKGANGGQGGTTLTTFLAERADLGGLSFNLIQIDQQNSLARIFGKEVLTVKTALNRNNLHDQTAWTTSFAPAYDLIMSTGDAANRVVLVDCGALQTANFLAFAAAVNLEEDLAEAKINSVFLGVTTANAEPVRQVGAITKSARHILPSARPVIVLNERDGRFHNLPPMSDAAAAFRDDLEPIQSQVETVVMPAIPGRSWAAFERQNVRFTDAINMPISDAMACTGLPRSEAKIARGDIAEWFIQMDKAFSKILDLGSAS